MEEKSDAIITSLVQSIINQVLLTSKRSASETWGSRQRLLTNLKNLVEQTDVEQLHELLEKDGIINILDENTLRNTAPGLMR